MASSGLWQTLTGWMRPQSLKAREFTPADALYYEILQASRNPVLYRDFEVADTIDGRFDALCLLQSLVMRRLAGKEGAVKELAQGLFDAMFQDMDLTLREMGVGDMGVGKRVKLMSEAYMGRLKHYDDAISSGDKEALGVILRRNLYRSDEAVSHEMILADQIFAIADKLAGLEDDDFLQGRIEQHHLAFMAV
ncbi:MAG: ubiquinol-cytochrome C chaperone family protein [Candidatus Puniceispirillaceae bacterium]